MAGQFSFYQLLQPRLNDNYDRIRFVRPLLRTEGTPSTHDLMLSLELCQDIKTLEKSCNLLLSRLSHIYTRSAKCGGDQSGGLMAVLVVESRIIFRVAAWTRRQPSSKGKPCAAEALRVR